MSIIFYLYLDSFIFIDTTTIINIIKETQKIPLPLDKTIYY